MSTLTTAKTVEVMFEKTLETYEKQAQLLPLVSYEEPDAAALQNAGNIIWRPKQQHAPILEGLDLTGQEQGIIEEAYPATLGILKNDFVKQDITQMRDRGFWERRAEQSGNQQVTELNKTIANAVAMQGTKFYEYNGSSGYEFVANAQAILNETQQYESQRHFVLNDRSNLRYSTDLSNRQTLQGRPEDEAWTKGQIGANVAQFDIHTGSYLPTLTGGALSTTVSVTVSEKPEAGIVDNANGTVTNNDYRVATITVADTTGFNAGDKVRFDNGSDSVQSIGLADKNETGQAMSFSIVEVVDATTVKIFPKPIALDDGSLTDAEKSTANIDTQILATAAMTRLNTAASAKTNLFWDKSAVEVLGGTLPAQLFKDLDGMKTVQKTMSNGQTMYMVYDGRIEDLSFRYRIFTWYGVTIANPQNCGVALSI